MKSKKIAVEVMFVIDAMDTDDAKSAVNHDLITSGFGDFIITESWEFNKHNTIKKGTI